MIDIVEKHRVKCELYGNYVEAEAAKVRIQELKEQEVIQKQEQMSMEQEAEKSEQDHKNSEEYQSFHEKWDKKLSATVDQHRAQLIELEERHTKELSDNREHLEKTLPIEHKPSSEYLNLVKVE